MAGYATSGRGWHNPAVAGLLRRDERVHAQSIKLVDCLRRVIASIGGILPWGLHRRCRWSPPSSPQPVAYPKSGWWPAPPRSPGERCPPPPDSCTLAGSPFPPGAGMMRDSVSVKLRWALSSGTPGCLRPSASACSAAACASASSAAMASRIFSNRPSRKANSCGNSSPRLSLPYRRSSSSSAAWACRNNSATSARQLRCLLLHPLVTHRLMLRCVGLDLRAVQRHVPQLHQTRLLAQRQYLYEQPRQRIQIILAKVGDGPGSPVCCSPPTP